MAEVKKARKRDRKEGVNGVAHVQASFNNTYVTITALGGHVITHLKAGNVGLKGSRKSARFEAQEAVERAMSR